MRLRSFLCFFIIAIRTSVKIKPDRAINYLCYKLIDVFGDLKKCCIEFDTYFDLVVKKVNKTRYEKLRKLFYKRSYYFLEKTEDLILATQNDDFLIRDKLVERMKGNDGTIFIEKDIRKYLEIIIQFRSFITSVDEIYFDIIQPMKIVCDSLEYELNAFKRYLTSLRNKLFI
ncbi:hypothetical protein NBO_1072g0003 [Nosema bombycis CQ1]|uniref:Uncharacterized protein n=1 Tax=Nosema bombycis (strain CQ1 / CVCC 102059) TaxID=578461 RepID=R0KN29_NOSB1|nr:hypothetical protein NBO_1072g0003 [Nosema bombycis CQ1]|eukprot:EOB11547.1 hypothetical protein NBO_1072g0003 [Nosema bombycis CQ1]